MTDDLSVSVQRLTSAAFAPACWKALPIPTVPSPETCLLKPFWHYAHGFGDRPVAVEDLNETEKVTRGNPSFIAEVDLALRALGFLRAAHEPDLSLRGNEHAQDASLPGRSISFLRHLVFFRLSVGMSNGFYYFGMGQSKIMAGPARIP
jgi:hypothetical protein